MKAASLSSTCRSRWPPENAPEPSSVVRTVSSPSAPVLSPAVNHGGSANPLKHGSRDGGFFADVRHAEDARRVPGSCGPRDVAYFFAVQREGRFCFGRYI